MSQPTKLPKPFGLRLTLLWALAVAALATAAPAQSRATFHSVYYHRLQGSFWAQLAADTVPGPTPCALAEASVQANFKAIRAAGFDTVTVGLPDSDNWVSQHGGGFSYDPRIPPPPDPSSRWRK